MPGQAGTNFTETIPARLTPEIAADLAAWAEAHGVSRSEAIRQAGRDRAEEKMRASKKDSSARQLKAAIKHFHEGDFDCAITLASAAEGILYDTNKPHLRLFLKERIPPQELNRINNWLKHSTGDQEINIYEPHAIAMIMRGITKFMAVYEPEPTPEFEEFFRWGEKAGYWKRPS